MKQHTDVPRILVVDDDLDLLMLLERRLIKEGYEVETAVSLHEAEEYLKTFQPDVLILDINVGGQDGRRLSAQIKLAGSQTKVIMISGYDYSSARAALFGADELIAKPMHFDYLLFAINKHLYGQQAAAIAYRWAETEQTNSSTGS